MLHAPGHDMGTHEELVQMHLQLLRHMDHLTQVLQPQSPLLHKEVLLLNTSQDAQFTVRLPFAARWVNVINQTAATLYLADGEPGAQPNDVLPIPAYTVQALPMDDVQILTVYQSGAAAAGANALILQASTQLLATGAANHGVQATMATTPPLETVTPRLIATIPYTDFPASTSYYPYYAGVLTRHARARTFQLYNTMDQSLASNNFAFYDSALGIPESATAQFAYPSANVIGAGPGHVSVLASEEASANEDGLSAAHVDSIQMILSMGATAPTSGNVLVYVSELL